MLHLHISQMRSFCAPLNNARALWYGSVQASVNSSDDKK